MGALELGTVLGGYQLEEVIGTGGMGAVYRATHVRLGRKAAIKVLSDSLSGDPAYVSRFFHEARVVNEVGHPNIIDIIDFIDTESPRRVAYIMELVEGPPLSKVLAARRLTARQCLNLTLQVLDALSAVHRINVIHRDLKPDNLLIVGALETDLSDRPSVKVLDFGIAKIQDHNASHRTSTGMMLGTPAYMAPEQVAAEPVSFATDIYAVGELLYEMLSGERLFRGPNMQILRAKVGEKPAEVSLPLDTQERARLTTVIARCVLQNQKERPTLAQLSAELRELLADLPQEMAPLPPLDRPSMQRSASLFQPTLVPSANTAIRSPSRAKSILIWTLATLLLVACGAIGGMLYLRSQEREQIQIQALPLPEPEKIEASQPVVLQPEPQAEPQPEPSAEPIKKKSKAKSQEQGPLKKGEFPSW